MIEQIKYKISQTTDKKELKKLYKELKAEYKKCAHGGHDFTAWQDVSYYEEKTYIEPYSIYTGYITVKYPFYKRVCKYCGYEELTHDKPHEKRK